MSKEDTIKTKIAVEGEKEYKTACKGINASLKEIGSEMKVVSATFSGNEKSTAALTEKQKALEKQLDAQKQKAKAAEQALKQMKNAGLDETNPAVVRMQTNLNEANAEMIKTENELKKTNTALKSSGVSWAAVGQAVGQATKVFGTAVLALGTAAVAAATALAGLTVKASQYADDLLTTSAQTRQSTDDLQKYAYAARFVDVEMNTLTKSMAKNVKSMDNARNGSALYANAYEKLGVSVTDANGELRNSNDVYWECIDALSQIENETECDALAMQLFGKSAQELNTVIDAGSEAFKSYGEEAERMGAVMSGEALAALGAFNDKLQVLDAGLDGLKNSASLIALPFLDVLAGEGIDILADFSRGIQQANGDVTKMSSVIGSGISDVLGLVVAQLPAFIDMGITMVQSLVEGIAGNAQGIAQAATQIVESLVTGLSNLLPVIINGAAQIVAGLAQGLAESLPTLIPQIVEMISTITITLIENIPLIIDAALQIVIGLAEGLLNAIPVLIAAIPTIITSLIDAVLSSIPLIIQAGIDLLTALVGALPEIITAIVEAIPQIITGIVNTLTENLPLIIQAGIDLFISLIQALPQIITTIVSAIPQIIGSVVNALISNIPAIIQAGITVFIALIQALPQIIATIVTAVPQIISGIVNAFSNLKYRIVDIGRNIVTGVWEGIQNAAAWFSSQVQSFFSGIVDGAKRVLGIASPSKVFAGIGENMAAGLGKGFGEEMNTIRRQINDETAALIPKKSTYTVKTERGEGYAATRFGGATVNVTQNIYASDTSYAGQQREAKRQLQLLAREVTA